MDMTITKQQRDLLIGLAGVLIAVAVWFLVASPMIEKKDAIKAENATLSITADEYTAVHARVDEYESELTSLTAQEEDILSHYPVDVQREDQLMLWANIDSAYPLEMRLGDVELGDWDVVAIAGAEEGAIQESDITYDEDGNPVVSDTIANDVTADYKLYSSVTAMEFASTYNGLKDMIKYIQSLNDKNAIGALEVNYDTETGLLSGGVGVKQYYIQGLDKEYVPSFIPSVPTGVSDVFRTSELIITDDADNADEADEETEE